MVHVSSLCNILDGKEILDDDGLKACRHMDTIFLHDNYTPSAFCMVYHYLRNLDFPAQTYDVRERSPRLFLPSFLLWVTVIGPSNNRAI